MTRTGSNDASGVVWAIGEFFSLFFHVFLYILTIVLVYSTKYATGRPTTTSTFVIYKVCDREDRDDENRLKRRVWRRLGYR